MSGLRSSRHLDANRPGAHPGLRSACFLGHLHFGAKPQPAGPGPVPGFYSPRKGSGVEDQGVSSRDTSGEGWGGNPRQAHRHPVFPQLGKSAPPPTPTPPDTTARTRSLPAGPPRRSPPLGPPANRPRPTPPSPPWPPGGPRRTSRLPTRLSGGRSIASRRIGGRGTAGMQRSPSPGSRGVRGKRRDGGGFGGGGRESRRGRGASHSSGISPASHFRASSRMRSSRSKTSLRQSGHTAGQPSPSTSTRQSSGGQSPI